MKAMILAAGRGRRMRSLTDRVPKPLLTVHAKPLIDITIAALVAAGYCDIVINYAYRGQQIVDHVGDGQRYGARIAYSAESQPDDLETDGLETDGLETGGGVLQALPLLGDAPFLLINADVLTDYPLASLRQRSVQQAHLVLVDNPDHHSVGDFSLDAQGQVNHISDGDRTLTFAGISLIHPCLFTSEKAGTFPLKQPLLHAIDKHQVSGEYYTGRWLDIGTPERLQAANTLAQQGKR